MFSSRRRSYRRFRSRQDRDEAILRLRRGLIGAVAVGCGALLLGLVGGAAGAMWSMALDAGFWTGAVYGAVVAFGLGTIMIPLNNRIGTTLPLGCISVALLLFLMLLGATFWLVRLATGGQG